MNKTYTIRLNETGQKEVEKIQEMFGLRSSQAAFEYILMGYRKAIEDVAMAEKELLAAKGVIRYLEEGGRLPA